VVGDSERTQDSIKAVLDQIEKCLDKVKLGGAFASARKATSKVLVFVGDALMSLAQAIEEYGTKFCEVVDRGINYVVTKAVKLYQEDPITFWGIILLGIVVVAVIPFLIGVIKSLILVLAGISVLYLLMKIAPWAPFAV
jgi:hypothetical protein